MYILVTFTDQIVIQPQELNDNYVDNIQKNILDKYHLKMIPNVGLCITVIDIITQNGHIVMGEGEAIFEVTCKAVVFTSQENELLEGIIIRSIPNKGLVVRFQGILEAFIPAQQMQKGSSFEESEDVWVWENQSQRMFYDIGEQVRFRTKVTYTDKNFFVESESEQTKDQFYIFETIIGCMNEPGLGVIRWWQK